MRGDTPVTQFPETETPEPIDVQRSLREYQRDMGDYLARQDLTSPAYENFTLLTGTTAGGLAAWQNRTNCDVIVTEFVLDVRTATTIFNMDFGTANSPTTASTNLFNATQMGGLGFYASTTPAVLVAADTYITGSSNGGAATGTFGGEAYVRYFIRQPIPR